MQGLTKNTNELLVIYPPLVFWILNPKTAGVKLIIFGQCGIQLSYEIKPKFPDDYSWSYKKICRLGSEIRKAGFYPEDHNMMRTVRRAIDYFNDYEPWHFYGYNVMVDFWWNESIQAERDIFYAI